jgi:FkbM family methyltransferase
MSAAVATSIGNVALGKPASQSSLSNWSSGNTVEADASIATNGDTASPRFFHTNSEAAPWWQVDLRTCFVIEQVRIFNRRDLTERLRRLTVLVSQTGAPGSWLAICRKDDDAEFGRGNDIPLVLTPDIRSLARFVRIRKDNPGFLHFRECEVLGYAPEADALACLREQTERARQRQADEQAAIEHELGAGRTGYVARIGAHAVFVDTDNYSPTLVGALTDGGYESRERSVMHAIIRPTDRILEIGTAVGVVTMTLAAIVGPANVITYDANPAMVADARRNFAANRMGGIRADVGVLRNRGRWSARESEIDFFVSRDFWASRLVAAPDSPDITGVVKVPLVCLESRIAEHRANVLVCDIEGGEADLLDGADLGPIRLVMLEIHYWAVGRQRIDDMIRFMMSRGFTIDFTHSGHGIVVLDRAP